MPKFLVLFTACSLLTSLQSAAELTASTNRTQYSPSDSITLTLESSNPHTSQLNLAPLQSAFILLDQRKMMINAYAEGKRSSTARWELLLRSRKSGTVTIPPISYNEEESAPITLFIKSQERSRFLPVTDMPIILDAQIALDDNYEQAQFLYTLNVYSDQPLSNGYSISAPRIDNARVLLLETSDTQDIEIRGKQYRYFEQRYAIFPNEMGRFVIEGPIFDGAQQNFQNTQVRANNIEINVRARLSFEAGAPWLPAESVTLSQQWQRPASLKVGDTITRTLTLSAQGLRATQLPVLNVENPKIIEILDSETILSDEINSKGIKGTRTEVQSIRLIERGEITFPSIEIPWWDIDRDNTQTAIVEKQIVNVSPRADGASSIERELAQNTTAKTDDLPNNTIEPSITWLVWLLTALTLLTSIGWLFNLRKMKRLKDNAAEGFEQNHTSERPIEPSLEQPVFLDNEETEAEPEKQSRHNDINFNAKAELSAFQALGRACLKGENLSVQTYLLEWGVLYWYQQPIKDLSDLANAADNASLNALLDELEASLYDIGIENPWQGNDLFYLLTEIRSE